MALVVNYQRALFYYAHTTLLFDSLDDRKTARAAVVAAAAALSAAEAAAENEGDGSSAVPVGSVRPAPSAVVLKNLGNTVAMYCEQVIAMCVTIFQSLYNTKFTVQDLGHCITQDAFCCVVFLIVCLLLLLLLCVTAEPSSFGLSVATIWTAVSLHVLCARFSTTRFAR
jgi:hypothetical protein